MQHHREEPLEQHDLQTRESLHHIGRALVHLWLTNAYLRINRLPTKSTMYVYTHHLEWGREILQGKRVKVTVEIEDY